MAGTEKQALHHDLNQRGRRASMRSFKDLVETKAELIRWVVRVGVLQTTLIVAIIVRLVKII